ncbi:ribosomal small subunit Rsm22, mitochondria [Zymoseptoria tritici IPO323]|uniref:Ribosomal small subunit Rsm22, mitochondria n=1 Tax=Zymoseptoria tritici (strain CBS 115943 / IPO323) TaxID=336722 RepID=F9XPV2_ZYMTI|nr:ribosomal small subunit Rsm22, mitochondria [Zymoseptoria tritici IPO323]EGP82531.1 ribosomal small subunit Rsm22, mitochondria [Zymoseptoria tritici IPO323]
MTTAVGSSRTAWISAASSRKSWNGTASTTRTFSTTPRSQARFTRQQEIDLVEGLFTSGQITRAEWRESVFMQAGVREASGVEERVRLVREWFGGEGVPGEVLEGEEGRVYERLFGGLREVVVQDNGVEGVGGADVAGLQVLREDGREVEFEEDDVEDEVDGKRKRRWKETGNEMLARDLERTFGDEGEAYTPFSEDEVQDDVYPRDQHERVEEEDPGFVRIHPLTLANRFGSTVDIPKTTLIDPITLLISDRNKHIPEHALRIFGGPGLPYSTSTPARGRLMQQKPIALDATQGNMAEMDGDVFLATLMPGIFASVTSVLVETRKRLGTEWAEGLVRKAEEGELRILDAGGAGAGVLAVREMLRAEWERMHEGGIDGPDSPLALAEADGRVGGAGLSPPLGSATVLAGSDALRRRAAKLLDNTTFIPRLPDYLHAEEAKVKGKFDIVIAPHSLWPLREDHLRKAHVQNLWHLLNADGGVLLLIEKGVSRGFEMIAGARDMLLDRHISSPDSTERSTNIDEPGAHEYADLLMQPKETGMIIAPCTNHTACPLYSQKGMVKGRRTICSFEQRYHRPAFLQSIFGQSGKNHEDVEFSYLSVLRGQDLRQQPQPTSADIVQGEDATSLAFAGYEEVIPSASRLFAPPNGLSLPRAILPPMKRTGHVILDVCTPSGTLERWTVPRSFSKQAFRDARKSGWGDLWALGAKTRVLRNGTTAKSKATTQGKVDMEAALVKKGNARNKRSGGYGREKVPNAVKDESGGVLVQEGVVAEFGRLEDGSTRERLRGRKVKGVREKRDKKGTGNGRVKMGGEGRRVLREAEMVAEGGRRDG